METLPEELKLETEEQRRQRLAKEIKQFRHDRLFTQKRLADAMSHSVGKISRRTIQGIEAGTITPHLSTLRLFEMFKQRHEAEQ